MININLHTIKTTIILTCSFAAVTIAGCASYIPGEDRITHPESKAEVGPVLTELDTPIVASQEPKPELAAVAPKESVAAEEQPTPTVIEAPTPIAQTPPQQTKIAVAIIESKEDITPKEQADPIPLKAPKPEAIIKPAKTVTKTYSVTGKVELTDKGKSLNPEGTIITIERQDGQALPTQNPISETFTIDMEDKTYLPAQMVIRKGDSVSFLNKDNIRHNVFSSTGVNAFDLGTYGAGLQRAVKLNEQGIVKVYCNIHPNMATFVAVDDIGISNVVDSNGNFVIANLPTGKYQLKAWNLRGEHKQLFTVTDNSVTVNVSIDTSNYVDTEHTNKFGKDYSKSTLNNEFY